ncbi:hypothetical protein ILUMI_09818 [Ignelater luminosus]|uniref:Dolichol-phosphate mannosyltransferase subunit 3 n=1 Tax=Ignelater luminosus TaxID=2038154 RepID=A0A8K0G9A4_IGNLU|nr:hypothetical protein ILUMI_09818 [Ignelater luminosus]
MTKLIEWLTVFGCIFCAWAALVTNKIENNFTKQYFSVILYSPIIFVVLFGVYAAMVVLYRTFTFNNCEEAAVELQKEIKEAREDLSKLGFKFKKRSK